MKTSIRTTSRQNCPVCKSAGIITYKNLTDNQFGAPGEWDLSCCKNSECNTFWLNPTPIAEDIPKLYSTYSTHGVSKKHVPKQNLLRKFLKIVRSSLLHTKYKYPTNIHPTLSYFFTKLSYLHPTWADIQAANMFYIPYVQNGKFLDVGCGNGSSMQTMKDMGWNVTGLDFDENAVAAAKESNLEVFVGDVFSQKFADNSFDAILMSHVIEHVPNPKEVIQECHRILKKNGTLSIITPNTNSRGHKEFKSFWRGLETPQHLQIFSVESLGAITKQIGFNVVKSFSSAQGNNYIWNASQDAILKAKDIKKNSQIQRLLNNVYTNAIRLFKKNQDEVAVAVATK